jgi:hypothetical protein
VTPSINDLVPLPWQDQFLTEGLTEQWPMDLAAIRGGLGSGKSLTSLALGVLLCETRPGASVGVGMDTFPRLDKVHLPLLQGLLVGSNVRLVLDTYTAFWPSGSRLSLVHLNTSAGAGQGKSPIEGFNGHALLLDECQTLRPDVLDVAVSRARIPAVDASGILRRPLVVTCGIPVEPAWWIDRTREIGGAIYLPTSAENAANLGVGWLERMRATLSDRDYAALVENRPLPPVGSVFRSWAPERCVVDLVPDWSTMRCLLTMDFGLRNPAALALAETGRNQWCVVREWAPDDESLPELLTRLAADCIPRRHWTPGDRRIPLDMVVCDPAGEARNMQTKISDLDLVRAPHPQGLGMVPIVERDPSRKDIPAGCTRVDLALERGALTVARQLYETGLRAPAGRRTLARALSGYRWDARQPGRPAKDGTHDHHADALRYAVRHVLWSPPGPPTTAPAPTQQGRGRYEAPGSWHE